MKRVRPGWMTVAFLLAWAVQTAAQVRYSGPEAAVSGVVRDVDGTPQMGAVIELLTADATTVASALSDDHGRYILPAVAPGKYELRATAAFFVPVHRANLTLHAGAQTIVNLTMSTLFEATDWLPTEGRMPDEPADDWKWTMRSSANRPLLRLIDPAQDGGISTSASEVHRASMQARLAMVQGDGGFGYGGLHQVLTVDREIEDGDGAILRADLGDPQAPFAVAPSAEITTGYQRQMPLGGRTRLVSSFSSQPELMGGSADGVGASGVEVLRLASAQQMNLGDAVLIDAGTLIEAERLEATRLMAEPYVRAVFRPNANVAVEFHYATGRELESSDDLDRLQPAQDVLANSAGVPLSNKGSHEEVVVSRKLGSDVISVALYRDGFQQGALNGSGVLDASAMEAADLVVDPTTATFRLATPGYSGHGLTAAVTHTFTPVLSGTIAYEYGTTLEQVAPGGVLASLETQKQMVPAAKASVTGKIARTGTSLTAEYRWQPLSTLTQVDTYDAMPDEAYLSFALRQKIWGGWILPQGIDAVVEATNLLEQGYQPVLAPDGRTLFLAQVPRAIEGGLAFNF